MTVRHNSTLAGPQTQKWQMTITSYKCGNAYFGELNIDVQNRVSEQNYDQQNTRPLHTCQIRPYQPLLILINKILTS